MATKPDAPPEQPRSLEQVRNEILNLMDEIVRLPSLYIKVSSQFKNSLLAQLQSLRIHPFATVVTKAIQIINSADDTKILFDEIEKLQNELLAIDISQPSSAAPNRLTQNPIVGELVDAVTIEISRRVAGTVDAYLEMRGIGGEEIQKRLVEADGLKKKIETLEAEKKALEGAKNELETAQKTIEEKERLIRELYRQMDDLLIAEALRANGGKTQPSSASLSEKQFLTLLQSPTALLGISTQEIMDLYEAEKDIDDFEHILKRKAQVALHPDKLNAFLESCPDPSLKAYIANTTKLRFQLLEVAVEEIVAQIKATGKVEAKWKHKNIK